MTQPMTILKTPYATGSFLNSVFQTRPSCVISFKILAPRASRSFSGPHGLTSKMTIDLATGGAFFFFAALASSAFFASAALASSSSSSPSANGSKSSSSSGATFFSSFAGFLAFSYLPTFYFPSAAAATCGLL